MTRRPRFIPLLALAAALLLPATPAPAQSGNGQDYQQSEKLWHQADQCSQEAFKRYPDYTAESNANRENFRRACLRLHNLPAPDGPVRPAPAAQ